VETWLRTGTLGDTSTEHRRFTVVFEIGAKVIYPSHGVAEIVGRESKAINGATETYLVLSVVQPGWGTRGWMKVSVPEDRAEALGVRAAISREDASDVIELLGMSDVHVPGNWSRRFKNHQEKLRSGDVYACAEVVRNLALRQRKSSLAAAETAMYTRARHSLISELAVSWGIGDDEAETRVDGALEPLVAD
jgi:CarD family transcriptional regulator